MIQSFGLVYIQETSLSLSLSLARKLEYWRDAHQQQTANEKVGLSLAVPIISFQLRRFYGGGKNSPPIRDDDGLLVELMEEDVNPSRRWNQSRD